MTDIRTEIGQLLEMAFEYCIHNEDFNMIYGNYIDDLCALFLEHGRVNQSQLESLESLVARENMRPWWAKFSARKAELAPS